MCQIVKCERCGVDVELRSESNNTRITDSGSSFDGELTTYWFRAATTCPCGEVIEWGDSSD